MKRSGLITLDIGGFMGFAYWKPGNRPFSGSKKIEKPYQTEGDFFLAIEQWLEETDTLYRPAHILFEAPFVQNINAVGKLYGIKTIIQKHCAKVGITCDHVRPSQWQSHAFKGKRAPKNQVKKWSVLAASGLGFDTVCEHEADAINMLDWFAHSKKLNINWPCGPLFNKKVAS